MTATGASATSRAPTAEPATPARPRGFLRGRVGVGVGQEGSDVDRLLATVVSDPFALSAALALLLAGAGLLADRRKPRRPGSSPETRRPAV